MCFIVCIKYPLSTKCSTLLGTGDIPVICIDMVPGLMELAFYLEHADNVQEINNTLSDGDKYYEENEYPDVL